MGIFDRLFGGKKQDAPPPRRRPAPERRAAAPAKAAARAAAPPAEAEDPAVAIAAEIATLDDMTPKALSRKLGLATNAEVRGAIAQRLGAAGDRSALRPMINTYLMHGDPAVLAALRTFGDQMTGPLREYSGDMSIVGERRGRLMDMLAATGDDQVLPLVRDNIEYHDPAVRSRACAALARLGDKHGIARLDQDLQTTDVHARVHALETLIDLDMPEARACVNEHIERFTAEAGAVPQNVAVTAPRIEAPQLKLLDYVLDHVRKRPHGLTLVIGSETIGWATSHRAQIEAALEGIDVRFATRRMVPEEQVAELMAARDVAASGRKAAFVGMIPSPRDEPPLPHFLTRPDGADYKAGVFLVDPHEYYLAQSWWQYVQDQAEVETDIEIVLGVSRPGTSAISQEEYDMYRMLRDGDQRRRFARALMARM